MGGMGTRFCPLPRRFQKEMLPVVDKPLIQYAGRRRIAGIRQMIFVTGRHKRSIEDHFDTAYELEVELRLESMLCWAGALHQVRTWIASLFASRVHWVWVMPFCVLKPGGQ